MDERRCDVCGSTDLVTIDMTVEGHRLSFTSCHNCESKRWLENGEQRQLRSVLNLVIPK